MEVNLYRTGVVMDGYYFGANAELNGLDQHPLHKYPAWSSFPDYFTSPVFPGVAIFDFDPDQSLSILFARDDWFPDPVLVQFAGDQPLDSIERSSIPLSQEQNEKLESLVNEGTWRRFYGRMIVIPYEGPHMYNLSTGAAPSVNVEFDLSDVIDFSESSLVPVSWQEPDSAELVYKADAQGVPFGLTVSFD